MLLFFYFNNFLIISSCFTLDNQTFFWLYAIFDVKRVARLYWTCHCLADHIYLCHSIYFYYLFTTIKTFILFRFPIIDHFSLDSTSIRITTKAIVLRKEIPAKPENLLRRYLLIKLFIHDMQLSFHYHQYIYRDTISSKVAGQSSRDFP